MATVITISGADKTGALARLYSFFARKGYGVRGHHVSDSGSGKLLSISIDAARIDREALSAEIRELNADYAIVGVAAEGGDTAEAQKKQRKPDATALKEMAASFPKIAELVEKYAEGFDFGVRDEELFAAGKKLGSYHFKKEWSLGALLKMPVALRRTLVPALEKMCEVEASDHEVVVKNSPFCGGDRLRCCCQFVTGFMQGFLDAGPGTAGSHVQKTSCKAQGGPHAAFAVKYSA